MPQNIRANGNAPTTPLSSPQKPSLRSFVGKIFGRKVSVTTQVPQRIPTRTTTKTPSARNAPALQKFSSIRPLPKQQVQRHTPPPRASQAKPSPSQQTKVSNEPAALRQLRADNALMAKLNSLPEPPNHAPGSKKTGKATQTPALPLTNEALTKRIAMAQDDKDLTKIWNHLSTNAAKMSLSIDERLTLKISCGNRLSALCNNPAKAKHIASNSLQMIINPKARDKAHVQLLEARLNALKNDK